MIGLGVVGYVVEHVVVTVDVECVVAETVVVVEPAVESGVVEDCTVVESAVNWLLIITMVTCLSIPYVLRLSI